MLTRCFVYFGKRVLNKLSEKGRKAANLLLKVTSDALKQLYLVYDQVELIGNRDARRDCCVFGCNFMNSSLIVGLSNVT